MTLAERSPIGPIHALRWDPRPTAAAERANRTLAKRMDGMIRSGKEVRVRAALRHWPPADVLAMMVLIRTKSARRLLDWLDEDASVAVLREIDPRFHAVLVQPDTQARLAKLLAKLDRDNAHALLEELPPDMAEDLLNRLDDAQATPLRAALAHPEDSAGAAMRHGLLTATPAMTVAEVIARIRSNSPKIERLDRLYVVGPHQDLLGYLRLRDLLTADASRPVSTIMRTNPVVVSADTDREDVLALADARGHRDLAVVDAAGRLIGGIAARELAEIAREEAEEDALIAGGVAPGARGHDGPLTIVKHRLPWILAGLIGAAVAAGVIGSYESALEEAAILASFIPVVMATAGNAGIQASTVAVQSLGRGAGWSSDLPGRLGRELAGAGLNGLLVGATVALFVVLLGGALGLDRPPALALTCFVALTLVTTLAGTFGAVVPLALKALKLDPAVATGIFITTANDVFGVLIFFVVASVLYL